MLGLCCSLKSIYTLLIGAIVIFCTWIILSWLRRPRNLPPGPWGLPIIGATFRLSGNLHEDFMRFGKQYGDIFSLYLGKKLFVIFNNADAIHDGFGKMEEFSDRPHNNIFSNIIKLKDVIFISPYSAKWKENKKFAVQAMKSFGFGTSSIESKVACETNVLLEYLLAHKGESISIKNALPKVFLNVIFSIMLNTRYDWDDPECNKVIKMIHNYNSIFEDGYVVMMFDFLPQIAKIVFRKQLAMMKREAAEFRKVLSAQLGEHRATFDPAHNRDVFDVYIKEGKLDEIGDESFIDTMFVFLPDAFETNAVMLGWILLYVTAHPEVQAKIHKELDDVIGQGRAPTLSDRSQLVYTEAVIVETVRMSNFITLTAFHKPLHDVTFKGFFIPQSATILGNIYSVHANPEAYPDLETFRPERFLGETGKKLQREHFMPFGVGRRMCMGESLVRIENFFILASIM